MQFWIFSPGPRQNLPFDFGVGLSQRRHFLLKPRPHDVIQADQDDHCDQPPSTCSSEDKALVNCQFKNVLFCIWAALKIANKALIVVILIVLHFLKFARNSTSSSFRFFRFYFTVLVEFLARSNYKKIHARKQTVPENQGNNGTQNDTLCPLNANPAKGL